MLTSVALASLAAVGVVSAVPVANPAPRGVSIALHKRTNIVTSLAKDGVIQPGALARHRDRVES